MKNYFSNLTIKERGYKEVDVSAFTKSMNHRMAFIAKMAEVIRMAQCGWDGVVYKAMKNPKTNEIDEFMVLYVEHRMARWIPIDGNSDACNFAVLGENLF